MRCERCFSNPSTICLTKIVGGEKVELHYCESCARIVGDVDFETPFSSSNFLESILENINRSPIKVNYILMTACSRCGMTYHKFKEIGRLGCSECYKSFDDKLGDIVKGIQGYSYHVGKVPGNSKGDSSRQKELQLVKRELQKAVEIEAFEEAAKLRDRLKQLEHGEVE